jgi:hypothetical protein
MSSAKRAKRDPESVVDLTGTDVPVVWHTESHGGVLAFDSFDLDYFHQIDPARLPAGLETHRLLAVRFDADDLLNVTIVVRWCQAALPNIKNVSVRIDNNTALGCMTPVLEHL